MTSENTSSTKIVYRGTQIVWYILGLLNTILAFRFILKLFNANPLADFTAFIYNISYPFVYPFLNVFQTSEVEGSVFEWSTLLAMIVYSIVAWIIIKTLFMGKPVSTNEADNELKEEVE